MQRRHLLGLSAGLAAAVGGATFIPTQALADDALAGPGRPATLRFGDTGRAVRLLQRALVAHGLTVAIDDSFGPATRAAVLDFQAARRLERDGVAGPQTWGAMLPDLEYGNTGAMVGVAQASLVDQGVALATDNSFGPRTRTAVYALQRSRGQAANGKITLSTWALLGTGQGQPTRTWVAMDQLQTGAFAKSSCGPTAATIALIGIGKSVPGYVSPTSYAAAVAQVRRVAGTTASGTSANGMQRAIQHFGAKDQRTRDTAAALRAARAGTAVILNGWAKHLPWLLSDIGHYVVVTGYDEASGTYQVLDPWRGRSKSASGAVLTAFGNSAGDPKGGSWREHHLVS